MQANPLEPPAWAGTGEAGGVNVDGALELQAHQ